jgi:aryl-alcohol dehydrogenase-like predicted oxidoreductase
LLIQVARHLRNLVFARRALYPRAQNLQQLQVIRGIAAAHNMSVSQVVLGYLLSQPFPTFPIVGCQNLHQLEDSLCAADVQLSGDEVAALDRRRLR